MSETIYSLVPHVPVVPVKPPMHKSKHNHGCALAGSTFGERHGAAEYVFIHSYSQHTNYKQRVDAYEYEVLTAQRTYPYIFGSQVKANILLHTRYMLSALP